jgi:hypothetical protein
MFPMIADEAPGCLGSRASHPSTTMSVMDTTPARPVVVAKEDQPYKATLTDGTTNVGSFEMQAAIGTITLAHDLLADRGTVSAPAVLALASLLMAAADDVQQQLRVTATTAHHRSFGADVADQAAALDFVDRLATSHTRARSAVASAVRAVPLPDTPDAASLDRWATAMTRRAVGLAMMAYTLAYEQPRSTVSATAATLAEALSAQP